MPKASRSKNPSTRKNPEHESQEEELQHRVKMMELEQKRQRILESNPTGRLVRKTGSAFPMKTTALMLIVAAIAYQLGPERLKTFFTEDASANVSSAMMSVKMRIPSMEKLYAMTRWPIMLNPPDIGLGEGDAAGMSLEDAAEHAAQSIHEHGWWAVLKMPFRWALAFCAYSPLMLGGVALAGTVATLRYMDIDFPADTGMRRSEEIGDKFKGVVKHLWHVG